MSFVARTMQQLTRTRSARPDTTVRGACQALTMGYGGSMPMAVCVAKVVVECALTS